MVFPAFYVFQMATTRMVWLIEFGNREYLYQDLRIYVFVLTIADEPLNFIVNIDQYNKVRLGAGWLFRFWRSNYILCWQHLLCCGHWIKDCVTSNWNSSHSSQASPEIFWAVQRFTIQPLPSRGNYIHHCHEDTQLIRHLVNLIRQILSTNISNFLASLDVCPEGLCPIIPYYLTWLNSLKNIKCNESRVKHPTSFRWLYHSDLGFY